MKKRLIQKKRIVSSIQSNRPKTQTANRCKTSPVKSVPRRAIREITRLLLFVRAGGRCEFDGCNEFLLYHHLTWTEGNFAEVAHIVAFNPEGPRGKSKPRPVDINDLSNLMLLCPRCHKLIDDNPSHYTIVTLESYKRRHEDRIYHVTRLGPDLKTTIVQLKANIGGHHVDIPISQVTEAVSPRYPTDPRGFIIDLSNIHGNDAAFMQTATHNITREIERLYAPGMDIERTRHISLFALAPIPLLVFLGRQLSNKIPVDLYQRHRDTESWTWKTSGELVVYQFRLLRTGTERSKAALILSLSGVISISDLPPEIDETFYIYEITLEGMTPAPAFLRTKQDLAGFKDTYQACLRTIMRNHGVLEAVHLFAAVPAPIAVLCGRELLPKVDPKLLVYDYDKCMGGFNFIMEVN